MRRFLSILPVLMLACGAQASWYWPFGEGESIDGMKPARLSELMEPASLLIDDAVNLAADGKTDEAVAKYRKALSELDRIEAENPERAKTPEFATLRNKRAYVNANIDSMLLEQVRSNAKAVAVSDTSELERRLAEERAAREKAGRQETRRAQRAAALEKIGRGDYAGAMRPVREMLEEEPNDVVALNLKAMIKAQQGELVAARMTLRQALKADPRNSHTLYNMARVMMRLRPDDLDAARGYYRRGRKNGGPVDEALEALEGK